MRTTLTIEDQIDIVLRKIAAKQHMSYKEVVNKALKKGIESMEAHEAPVTYKVRSKAYGFQPGVDPEKLNQLVDELEVEE